MKSKQALEHQVKEKRSASLVVNTHSRQGRRLFSVARDSLEQRGIHVSAAYPVSDPERLGQVIEGAIQDNQKLIIVGGGDGTISSIVGAFAYQDVVLGILPLGTNNSFARTLKIPASLEGAIEVIAQGKVVDVDLGKVGSKYFANTVSIGLTVDIARKISRPMKRILGPVAYGLVGLQQLAFHRSFGCLLKAETGETIQDVQTHQVFIANGRFVGVGELSSDASPESGEFIVWVLDTTSRWRLLLLMGALVLGKHPIFSQATFLRTKEVKIETRPPQYIDKDGEITSQTPVTMALAPQSLKVMAPTSFEEVP